MLPESGNIGDWNQIDLLTGERYCGDLISDCAVKYGEEEASEDKGSLSGNSRSR